MPPLPPFVQSDDEGGAHFYALAYCRGAYGSGERREEPVFLVLYFCMNPRYTDYSLHIVDADGRCHAYSRGHDDRDTLEYALMRAWARHLVSPAVWRLYPRAAIAEDAWTASPDEGAAYSAARANFCRIVHPFRLQAHFAAPPHFHLDPDFVPPSMLAGQSSEESREIFQAVMEAAARPRASRDEGD